MSPLRFTFPRKSATMNFFLPVFFLISFISVFGQSDTVIVFYDRDGKVCDANSAIKFSLQMKENDHYKRIKVDGMDNKIESVAYFTDAECKTFDGPYREIYKNGSSRTSGY